MYYMQNCVFIDKARFNIHFRRNFARSKIGTPAKAVVPINRGVSSKPQHVPCPKKRKRNNGSSEEFPYVDARVGSRTEQYIEFTTRLTMDTLDADNMKSMFIN